MARTGAKKRRLIEALALGAIAAIILRTWGLAGLFVPLRVAGPSMAETFLGMHYRMPCGSCGFPFNWDAGGNCPPRPAACPNCGFTGNDGSRLQIQPGDRILVVPAAFSIRPPRRWESVVIRQPGSESELAVKRVVGLPGETVGLQQGDLYIDGCLQRKTLAEQHATAALVHDSRYPAADVAAEDQPWHTDREASRWRYENGTYVYPASVVETSREPSPSPNLLGTRSATAGLGADWLVFSLKRQLPGGIEGRYAAPITNLRSYNQGLRQRSETVFPVTDLLLSVELALTSGSGCLYLAATDGRDEFCVRIEPTKSWASVLRNGKEIGSAVKLPAFQGPLRIELSLIDRQLLLSWAERTIVAVPLDGGGRVAASVLRPFAIGSDGVGIQITQARVFRDIYYTATEDGIRGESKASWDLGDGQFFVLGDNSVYSQDSRAWTKESPITSSSLLGKPLKIGR